MATSNNCAALLQTKSSPKPAAVEAVTTAGSQHIQMLADEVTKQV